MGKIFKYSTYKKFSLFSGDTDFNCRTSDDFLVQFLRARKYSIPKSFSLLKKYMNFKRKNVSIFTGMDYDRLEKLITSRTIRFLPYRCPDGCAIIAVHLGKIFTPIFSLKCDLCLCWEPECWMWTILNG